MDRPDKKRKKRKRKKIELLKIKTFCLIVWYKRKEKKEEVKGKRQRKGEKREDKGE